MTARVVPWLGAAAFAGVALWAAPDYGLTFDAQIWFPYGDAVLAWLTGRGGWPVNRYTDGFEAYGSLGALGSALTSAVLHGWLGVTDAVLGHHVFVILCGAALVGLTMRLGTTLVGLRVGVLAGVLLATLPRFFAEAEGNPSDLPAAVAVAVTVLGVVESLRTGRLRPLVGAALGFAALGATRLMNAPFLVLLVLGWVALDGVARRQAVALWRRAGVWRLATVLGVALVGLWALRPVAWGTPLEVARTVLDRFLVPPYWTSKGVVDVFWRGQVRGGGPPSYHPVMLALTTPLTVLAAALLGLGIAWARRRSVAWLLTVWVGVAVGRHVLLARGNYDGVRHVLDVLPALALLAALGIEALMRRMPGRTTAWTLGLLAAAPGVLGIVRLHPYPVAYYNGLVGGLAGAASRFETEYSGTAYRAGLTWAATRLNPRDVLWVARPYDRPLVALEADWLGLDRVRVWRGAGAPVPAGRLFTMQIFRPGRREWRPARLDPATLPLVHEVRRQGVPLLRIRRVPATRWHWAREDASGS